MILNEQIKQYIIEEYCLCYELMELNDLKIEVPELYNNFIEIKDDSKNLINLLDNLEDLYIDFYKNDPLLEISFNEFILMLIRYYKHESPEVYIELLKYLNI